MSDPLKSIEREKLYLEIVEQILDAITSGAFPRGSALPPERIMASQLGVSRASVREAIRVLEHAGVLDVRMGSGTFVVEDGPSPKSVLRTRAALIGEHSPLDISHARLCARAGCRSTGGAQPTRQRYRDPPPARGGSYAAGRRRRRP